MNVRKLCMRLAAPAGAGALALAGLGAATAQAATLPPDLQALEQKMTQLQVSTERFATQFRFGVPLGEGGGKGANFSLTYGITGEAALGSTLKANLALHVGKRVSHEVLVGDTLYVREPWIARFVHGRRWVRIPKDPLSQVIGFDPTETASSGKGGGPLGTFAKLLGIVNGAQTITETGPATVDGQATTGFLVHFDPKHLLGVFSQEQLADLEFLGKPSVELELFVSADGVPVRTLLKMTVSGIAAQASVDILQINAPVSVKVPGRRQYISKALRRKLLKRKGVKVAPVGGPKLP